MPFLALMGVAELAKGVEYTDPITTGWRPPRYIIERSEEKHNKLRKKLNIFVEGEDLPPPIKTFKVFWLIEIKTIKLDVKWMILIIF